MLALYLLTLGVSAGIVGAFAHNILADAGYAPTFQTGVMLAGTAACLYVCLQLLYVTLIRVLKPTRQGSFYFVESMSHLAALLLLPYLLHVSIDWPEPMLQKVEPLLYLAAFSLIHCLFKGMSFFASLWSEPSGRAGALGWVAAAALFAIASGGAFQGWSRGLDMERPRAEDAEELFRVGGAYANARSIPEGAAASYDLETLPNQCLTLLLANSPDLPADEVMRDAYITVRFTGSKTGKFSTNVRLKPAGWGHLRIPAESIPPDVRGCEITWTAEKTPSWLRVVGFQPVVRSNRRILISRPLSHESRGEDTPPNLIIIAMDGLASSHMSAWGYKRDTTSYLDSLANVSVAFPNAYTPSPEAKAAYATFFTGMNPIRHGILGSNSGPLPEGYRALAEFLLKNRYATAAFTEGDADGTLTLGSGFERGFELFDPSYVEDPAEPAQVDEEDAEPDPTGCAATIARAREWIGKYSDAKFAVFIRLHELADLKPRERHGREFLTDGAPCDLDLYDTALKYLDEQAGALIKEIRENEMRKNTCIIVMSPYGRAFTSSGDSMGTGLVEDCLRVPLIVHTRELAKERRVYPIGLEDVLRGLGGIAGFTVEPEPGGHDFLAGPVSEEPVSMAGNPLLVSTREGPWRFLWETNWQPFKDAPIAGASELTFSRVGGGSRAASPGSQSLATCRERLEAYLLENEAWRKLKTGQ